MCLKRPWSKNLKIKLGPSHLLQQLFSGPLHAAWFRLLIPPGLPAFPASQRCSAGLWGLLGAVPTAAIPLWERSALEREKLPPPAVPQGCSTAGTMPDISKGAASPDSPEKWALFLP